MPLFTPTIFIKDPSLLEKIRQEVVLPPDPQVLLWQPLPTLNEQAVALNARLARAAREREEKARLEAEAKLKRPNSSSFSSRLELNDQQSSNFFQSIKLGTTTDSPKAVTGFGVASGRSRKKDKDNEEKTVRRRSADSSVLSRLKTEFLHHE